MKNLVFIVTLLIASAASADTLEILSCSNLHKISDPQFQQGDEIFLKLNWDQKYNSLEPSVSQLNRSSQYSAENFQLVKPELSWLSMKGTSPTGETMLFRFAFLGGQTWGGYFDGDQQDGSELLCQESRYFQKFIDANR